MVPETESEMTSAGSAMVLALEQMETAARRRAANEATGAANTGGDNSVDSKTRQEVSLRRYHDTAHRYRRQSQRDTLSVSRPMAATRQHNAPSVPIFEFLRFARAARVGKPTSKHVLLMLVVFVDRSGLCWPSQAALAEYTGLCLRAVQTALADLERKGFIQRRKRFENGRRTSDYIQLLVRRQHH